MNTSSILILLFLIFSVLASPFEKKADIATFTSAINGAGRLRYGKRSNAAADWTVNVYPDEDIDYNIPRYQYSLIKRALNADSLAASLNGAERLRFGRK